MEILSRLKRKLLETVIPLGDYQVMTTPARFSDGQYKNWIKCSQSLIIMKEALHGYIDKEVKILHADITQKVSSIPCGSSTGNQCGSCSWKNIKLTRGNPRTWSINCKNSICDKWLHEILAVHDDPYTPTINWKNADISKWPTDCYQVAKIFMPKGQHTSRTMPEDLDVHAILSLLKYCSWFRKDLPNTQILSDLIEIQKKVAHSTDRRVEDSDKDRWIDKMIQLLNDLNIHSEEQDVLQMIKCDNALYRRLIPAGIFSLIPVMFGVLLSLNLRTETVPITSVQPQQEWSMYMNENTVLQIICRLRLAGIIILVIALFGAYGVWRLRTTVPITSVQPQQEWSMCMNDNTVLQIIKSRPDQHLAQTIEQTDLIPKHARDNQIIKLSVEDMKECIGKKPNKRGYGTVYKGSRSKDVEDGVVNEGASAIGLQKSLVGLRPGKSHQNQHLESQDRVKSIFQTTTEQTVLIPKNPRGNQIINLSVEDMTECIGERLNTGGYGTVYKGLPPEILRMDEQSQQLYREALEAGKVKVYNIRLMIVGHLGVGKTTLVKRILGEKVEKAPHVPTEGIEVHPRCCKIDQDDDMKNWTVEHNEHCSPNQQILVNMVYECVANKSNDDIDQEEKSSMQHLTEVSGAIEVSFEPDKEMSKSDVMQLDTSPTSDKNTLYEKEKVHENQTLLDLDKSHNVETDSNKAINIKGRSDTNIHSDLHEFVTKCGTMTPSEKTFCYVTMLDFAGEFVYYTTHQAFMSWRTLYLLVTDISKSLEDSVKGDECSMKRSIQDYVIYWFNSIYSHGMPSTTSRQREGRTRKKTEKDETRIDGAAECPPVILLATHYDDLPEEEKNKIKDEYFERVRRILMDRPQRFLLQETIAINNFGPADDIDALKQKIFELAEKQDYWGEEIPGTWLVLEEKLMELKRREKIIEYSRVDKINNSSDVKIKKPEELEIFLRFEHDLGNILFFNTEKLRGKIVLDPVWVIDGVRNLTSPDHCMIKKHPQIYPQWYKFKDTGQLTESLIGHLWSGDEREDFAKNREHLLDLMEELSIIAKPVKKDNNVQDQKLCYWVPCMIDKPAPDHVKNRCVCEGITRTSTLGFVSKTEFIHVAVFHRLLASFLSIWQPVKENEDKYRLYSDCCEFELEDCHSLLLIMNDYVILATILRCEEEDPDNELCCSIKRCISSTLNDITSCISPNVKFDMCVKCDKSSTYTLDGLHPCSEKRKKRCQCSKPDHPVKVENLMKFWERKDSYQQQQEAEKSDFLNAAKQQDHTTQHDSPGPIEMYRNVGVKDEIRVSSKDQAGNMRAEIDWTDAVSVHKELVQCAKSVGMISSPSICGTGFRVGPCYIMTAKHVVEKILMGTPVPLQQPMQFNRYHQLSNISVYIDFAYERDGIASDANLRFHFEPEIVYSNVDLDTVVLKLRPDSKEYPPPLIKFHDVAQTPQDRSHGYFIGHSRASIKKTDRYNFVMPTPDTITAAKKWSMGWVQVDGYDRIDDSHRVLFHCSFEEGASGAPGLWICPGDGNAYVEVMLLRGYPSWYYDDKYKDKIDQVPKNYLVEQGVTMKSICDDMQIRNKPLCKEIFLV